MNKITVVFSSNDVVIDGRYPWIDSEGNRTQPETCKGGDVFEELKTLKSRVEELEEGYQRLAENIHYPDCWDEGLMAYPTLVDALLEITTCNVEDCIKERAQTEGEKG